MCAAVPRVEEGGVGGRVVGVGMDVGGAWVCEDGGGTRKSGCK